MEGGPAAVCILDQIPGLHCIVSDNFSVKLLWQLTYRYQYLGYSR